MVPGTSVEAASFLMGQALLAGTPVIAGEGPGLLDAIRNGTAGTQLC